MFCWIVIAGCGGNVVLKGEGLFKDRRSDPSVVETKSALAPNLSLRPTFQTPRFDKESDSLVN